MTCRDEILVTVNELVKDRTPKTFHLSELMDAMRAKNTRYLDSTIRTHVTSRMCQNTPKNHQTTYDDFERVGVGVYRLL
ncbi:hypothetical protein [Deinococcus sp. QL22]|uniref:DUF7669 domain-containing protein n=1 Tax=Deinococcus sp. QL22 TaxID=2939437 RepID=UPI002017317F|nr:hypothetical protein [Deinococcus sp. QL22]UQN05489.1 hypothetical protein M1R55_11445 [Deinococcus sp. QL22]